jgi:ABC-2 type transport system permease protein
MRLITVARKQWRERARADLWFLVLVQPLVFCLLWGFCASFELRDVPVAVLDGSGTRMSRQVVRELEASGAFKVAARVDSVAALDRDLVRGTATMGLVLPAHVGGARHADDPPVLVVADGSDANIATAGVADAVATVQAALDPTPAAAQPEVRAWYSPSLRSADVLLPGAMGYNLTFFFFYPAESLIAERRRGTLAALAASPVRAVDVWLGTLLPNLVFSLWGALVQLALMVLVAGVPFRGHGLTLLAGLTLLSVTHLNIGCALARVVPDTAKLTVYGLLTLFPVVVCSGFFIPRTFLPTWTQTLGEGMPLKHGLVFLRAVLLKGTDSPHELRVLLAFAAATSVLAFFGVRGLLRKGSVA